MLLTRNDQITMTCNGWKHFAALTAQQKYSFGKHLLNKFYFAIHNIYETLIQDTELTHFMPLASLYPP